VTPQDDRVWQPATFRERGAAVPFTSPMLAGARARLTERRCDLVVPHPGGARGVYIFALASMGEFCAPTLHDMRLAGRLGCLLSLTPSDIRLAARAVAIEGAAGRAAAAAAEAAEMRDGQAHAFFEALLMAAGGQQTRPLSDVLVGAGLAIAASHAGAALPNRGAALVAALDAIRPALARQGCDDALWGAACGGAGQAGAAFGAVAAAGRLLVAAAQRLIDDPAGLLAAWAAGPDQVIARLGRPDWLLDGWEQLCLLWQLAQTDGGEAEAAAEIAAAISPMPAEADAWLGVNAGLLAPLRQTRPMLPPCGAALSHGVALVARNERLRGLAA